MDVGAQFALELGRAHRRWRARLDERLRHTGLTQARWIVLLQLSQAGPLAQRDLAEKISVEGPTLVRVLDKLEEQGFVLRLPCEHDRRVKRIHLTEAAAPVLDEITRISKQLRQELLSGVPRNELRLAWKLLKELGDRLEKS
ncbi:MAG: MarR family transcriptional regulator [Rhizobiales bacterium]|nr:MarR family transcriptional regulator [Hyphomicrobiales bacterium]